MQQKLKQKDVHIAPMLDVSTPEFHHFMRILTKKCILWTAMHVDETIAYTDDLDRHLKIESPHLHPIICQIGGRSPELSAKACQIIKNEYGYDEINLNIDCPSSRVSGRRQFGAVLMADEHKETTYRVVEAMASAVASSSSSTSTGRAAPTISVKTRVGIETPDGRCLDTLDHLIEFIGQLRKRGCKRFCIHARKCVIGGLSPIQNRIVPPLNYPRVYSLCNYFPDCQFVINGGIPGLEAGRAICLGNSNNDSNSNSSNNHNNVQHNNHEGDDDNTGHHHDHDHHQQQHVVPCKICNASNGSCTTPPLVSAPPNLVGVMFGRPCMENPAMFWDVDRYWYGEKENPCRNRRQVLDQYISYLEETYPRRCCDSDERVTARIPAPVVVVAAALNNNNNNNEESACPICSSSDDDDGHDDAVKMKRMSQRLSQRIKITSHVIDRSLKPINGIFFGLPKSQLFRRECQKLSRDSTIRNCGPAFILKKALEILPASMLDDEFVITEKMTNIPVHHGPSKR